MSAAAGVSRFAEKIVEPPVATRRKKEAWHVSARSLSPSGGSPERTAQPVSLPACVEGRCRPVGTYVVWSHRPWHSRARLPSCAASRLDVRRFEKAPRRLSPFSPRSAPDEFPPSRLAYT
jgi:hypothetical protein